MTLVIAHRGASAAERENTVRAFRRAVELGADGIELDVRRSGDDRLVVHHDPHLPDGRAVRDTPHAELPDDVPDLDSALDACAGAFVNIEIKNDPNEPDHDPGEWVAHRVAGVLATRGGGPRWLVSSFRLETVDRCRAVAPTVRRAWLTMGLDRAVVETALAHGHTIVHPWVGQLARADLAAAHAAGLAVHAWTCDDPTRIAELIEWGVDGIFTNRPDLAVQTRRPPAPPGG